MFRAFLPVLAFLLYFGTLPLPGTVHLYRNETCALEPDPVVCNGSRLMWYFDPVHGTCQSFAYDKCGGNNNRFDNEIDCLELCADPPERCFLGVDRGPCNESISKWYHDFSSHTCKQFSYGGCGGNENRFETFEDCFRFCYGIAGRCLLPADPGPCNGRYYKWYYDLSSDTCKRMDYGRCEGNKNRFQTFDDCNLFCSRISDWCFLPADRGPCNESHSRWYYDASSKICKQFSYGGCEGNENRFATLEDCYHFCDGITVKCRLPVDTGPCKRRESRWYYDVSSDTCKQFLYGGCTGNENRFGTLEDCSRYCYGVTDRCLLPVDPGPCNQSYSRWYYDASSHTCKQFNYGGCEGSENRFGTFDDCSRVCYHNTGRCLSPPDPGPCTESRAKYYYDLSKKRCEQFNYGGCGGNGNRYDTLDVCSLWCGGIADRCLLPEDPGPCNKRHSRWYYDVQSHTCNQFSYGGCQGNDNRFETLDDCSRLCYGITDRCLLPADRGSCNESLSRWYYDVSSHTCKQFNYGGCGGNENRFGALDDCSRLCYGITGRCFLPPDPGPCTESHAQWYYDLSRKRCEQFSYGGCGGNGNRFEALDGCSVLCGRITDRCLLPADPGPCNESIARWYYDVSRHICELFSYGGCEGNDNRFETLDDCSRFCYGITEISCKNDTCKNGGTCTSAEQYSGEQYDLLQCVCPPGYSGSRCEKKNAEGPVSQEIMSLSLGVLSGIIIVALLVYLGKRCIFKNRRKEIQLSDPEMAQSYLDLSLQDQGVILPYDEKWEFPKTRLKFGRTLGSGMFGNVVKAKAIGLFKGSVSTVVAVKMVKDKSDTIQRKALLAELRILSHLGQHVNIVNLLGAVTKTSKRLMVIVEYCRFGSLREYLLRNKTKFISMEGKRPKKQSREKKHCHRRYSLPESSSSSSSLEKPRIVPKGKMSRKESVVNKPKPDGVSSESSCTDSSEVSRRMKDKLRITTSDLICFAFQCSSGMQYLTSKRLIHRDLAARNTLLADDNVVKICDFGLTKDLYDYPNYVKTGKAQKKIPLPVRWMAIESIEDRVFTTKSDVWSFGILLWEFFSFGAIPYPGLDLDENFYEKIRNGYRMKKPKYAPDEIYEIMQNCWKADPNERPNFSSLKKTLGDLLEVDVKQYYLQLNETYVKKYQRLAQGNAADVIETALQATDFNPDVTGGVEADKES